MPRTSAHPKEENFNFRVPADLKAAFQRATEKADRPAAQVIRDFMKAYVNEHQKPEAGYDFWLRQQIEEAMNDTSPNLAHHTVMENVKAAIDHINKK